jgi:hypothetical protein
MLEHRNGHKLCQWGGAGLWCIALSFLLLAAPALGGKLSPEDLKKKREGWYPTGLPLINYTTDAGLGYGLRAYYFNNGKKDDPYFDRAPYFVQLEAQFFQSTRGQAYHDLQVDLPYLGGTKWRLKGEIVYWSIINANYFGIGANNSDASLLDADGKSYATAEDYQSFLDSGTDDASLLKYNNYQRRRIWTRWLVTHEFTDWLQVVGGFEFGHISLTDWQGESFSDGDNDLVSAATRFTRDLDQLVGSKGGWINMLVLGLKLDWRDFEPNPKEGFLGEYFLELSGTFLGSGYDYIRQTASIRGYYTFFNRLTLAARLALTYSAMGTPFYETSFMTFFRGRDTVLGGNRSLRGSPEERYNGRALTLAQFETRFFVGETMIFGQRFGLMPLAFVEAGNVYDEFNDLFAAPRFDEYKSSYGGGVVIPWNLTTLIHVFYGLSSESSSLFINFNHAF